jgi:hypothetical protein
VALKLWDTSPIFKSNTQSKQSPIGRKVAQSGHPVRLGLGCTYRWSKDVTEPLKASIDGNNILAFCSLKDTYNYFLKQKLFELFSKTKTKISRSLIFNYAPGRLRKCDF